MSNSIFELVKSHCSIFDTKLQNVKLVSWTGKTVNWIFQLDFLSWYVDSERIEAYWLPWIVDWLRDNPNWVPTEYENVYLMAETHWENISIDYQIVIPNKSPVKIINWWYFKVRQWSKYIYRWRVSIYWKALKLYYMGYLPRLTKYVIKYWGECCRADLCWDFPFNIPDAVVDLPLTWTNHSTRYFWEKTSPLFFRIYDKTQDLRKDKNSMAWLYPKWYIDQCWRFEAQFSWNYSRSMTPIDWLSISKVDKSKIQKIQALDRNVYKTALYSVINTIDWINLSSQEKVDILVNSKKLIEKKVEKLTKDIL